MFIVIENQLIYEDQLGHTLHKQDPEDETKWQVYTKPRRNPEQEIVLKTFSAEADAIAYISKVQDALVADEYIATLDLR